MLQNSLGSLKAISEIVHDLKRVENATKLPELKGLTIDERMKHRFAFDQAKMEAERALRSKGIEVASKEGVQIHFISTVDTGVLEMLVDDMTEYVEAVDNGETPRELPYEPALPDYLPTSMDFWNPSRGKNESSSAWNKRSGYLEEWVSWFRCEGVYRQNNDLGATKTIEELVNELKPEWSGNAHTQVSRIFTDIRKKRKEYGIQVNETTDKALIKMLIKKKVLIHPYLEHKRLNKGQTIEKKFQLAMEADTTCTLSKNLQQFKGMVRDEYFRIISEEASGYVLKSYEIRKPRTSQEIKKRDRKQVSGFSNRDTKRQRRNESASGDRAPRNTTHQRWNRSGKNPVVAYVKALGAAEQKGAILRLLRLRKNNPREVCQICGKNKCAGIVWESDSDGTKRTEPRWDWTRCPRANKYETDTSLPYQNLGAWRRAIQYDWSEELKRLN